MASWSACARPEGESSSPGVVVRVARVSPSDPVRPDQRFPRQSRLTARAQFLHVYDKGRRVSSPSFLIFGLPNDVELSRLGITVTRRVGNAVRRNRIKRRLRDIFRRHRLAIPKSMDLVINARSAAYDCPALELEREFVDAVARLVRRYSPGR